MAVALSLLIVLPGLAQSQGYDDTRGTLSGGSGLVVDVLDDASADLAGSYFNGSLYVSNNAGKDKTETTDNVERDGAAHNRVRISATGASIVVFPGPDGVKDEDSTTTYLEAGDNVSCAVATVKNNRSGKKITVRLNTSTLDGNPDSVVFQVAGNGTEESSNGTRACGEELNEDVTKQTILADGSGLDTTAEETIAATDARMPARHGDTLTITVDGVAGSVTITVDGDGPDFTEISPADKAYISSQTVKFRFVVTDSDSGLAHDGELDYTRGDLDARAINGDDDNFTSNEPRANADRSARDISVVLGSDRTADGSSGWRVRGGTPGVSYFLDMAVTNVGEGPNPWRLEATDRAGNKTQTDADSSKDGKQDFTLTVDVSSPEFKEAFTGISYDPSKKTEIVDRSYIAVIFKDVGGLEAVKDVDPAKFLVEDAEVVGYIHLTDKSDCGTDAKPVDEEDQTPKDIDGECLNKDEVPNSRIYLQLAEELAPDATPQVSMFGGAVLDLAGNPSNQDEVIAADNIAPAITVTLTSDVTDRPAIKNNGEVTVTITSDEDLRRLPTIWFARLVDAGSTAEKLKVKLATPRRGSRVSTDTAVDNAWTGTYNNGGIGSSDGLYAVIVIAEDDNDNIGSTPGWSHKRSDNAPPVGRAAKLADLESAGLLVEIDTDIADPVFSLAPETDVDTDDSESSNPFITIDFKSEKDEYGDYLYKEGSAPTGKETGDKIKNFGDSHSAVEITSITLNGNDVSGQTAAVSNRKYTLAARDLATGAYELKVTGRDDVGNEVKDSYKFDVVARKPYELDLTPGWNLVSLPGTPLDSSIGAVMGDSMQASIVLAYQDDAWLTAVNDNGTWRGTLTDIVGGYGYWVQTTAFESISALIPETDTSSVLPTAQVIKGWNLLGVVDVLQAPAGDSPSDNEEADDYFNNIAWRVAYSFDTSNNQWEKSIPKEGAGDEIFNGKGYWVWSTAAGVLVP